MKNTHALLAVSLIVPNLALAQSQESWVGGFVEYYKPDGEKPAADMWEDSRGPGLEYGLKLTPDWAVRFEWAHMNIQANTPFEEEEGDRLGIDGLYFINQSPVYAFAGVKHQKLDTSYKLVNLGIGRHWTLSDNWKIITELAGYHDFGQDFDDYGIKVGLAYHFGGSGHNRTAYNDDPVQTATAKSDLLPSTNTADDDGDSIINSQDQCPATPFGDKVDSDGCSIFTEQTLTQNLQALFANDSDVITNPDADKFRQFAKFMQRFGKTTATIEGHTSAPGTIPYNQDLSERRASAVTRLLVERYGIDANRLKTMGYGETRLLDNADTAEAHRLNRRIEATVTATQKVKVSK